MAVERPQRTRHRRAGTDLEYPRSHATGPRRILREARVSAGCVADCIAWRRERSFAATARPSCTNTLRIDQPDLIFYKRSVSAKICFGMSKPRCAWEVEV